MDDFSGFDYSWNGFLDYIQCFHTVSPLWIAVGSLIMCGTVISLIPQLFRIVKLRSSHGISPFFVIVTTMRQLLGVLNVFCLHSADFFGMLQISPSRTIPRELTFGNLFLLWILYLPVVSLVFIFFDVKVRANRNADDIKREWKLSVFISCSVVVITFLIFIPMMILVGIYGPASAPVLSYGRVVGTISALVTVCQYLPQIITTCRIKDNGSFSLVTLCIQAPGGTLNAIFMIFGNDEDWTTWLSTFSSAVQQWILLSIIVYYKIKRRSAKLDDNPLLKNDTTNGSVSTVDDSTDIKRELLG